MLTSLVLYRVCVLFSGDDQVYRSVYFRNQRRNGKHNQQRYLFIISLSLDIPFVLTLSNV